MSCLWIKFLLLSFASISLSIKLECEFKQMSTFYICNSSSLVITSKDDRTITEVTGEHEPGKSTDEVTEVHLDQNVINYFPKGLENFFPTLDEIDITNSKLKEITKEDLSPFPDINKLFFSRNEIKVIPADLFENNPNLVSIVFDKNKISKIEPGAISKLKELEYVSFGDNECVSDTFGRDLDSESYDEMQAFLLKVEKSCEPKATNVPATGSTLEDVSNVFAAIERQSEIMDSKMCSLFPPKNEYQLKLECVFEAVHTFDKYTCFPKSSFSIITRFERTITAVDGFHDGIHFKNSSNANLRAFKSVNNKIKFFPRSLTNFFPNIDEVDISHAGLREITEKDLQQFGEKLVAIRLSYNELKTLEANVFQHNPNLVEIQLDVNQITFVDQGVFSNLKKNVYLSFYNPCYLGKGYYKTVADINKMGLEIESKCRDRQDPEREALEELLDCANEFKERLSKLSGVIDLECPETILREKQKPNMRRVFTDEFSSEPVEFTNITRSSVRFETPFELNNYLASRKL